MKARKPREKKKLAKMQLKGKSINFRFISPDYTMNMMLADSLVKEEIIFFTSAYQLNQHQFLLLFTKIANSVTPRLRELVFCQYAGIDLSHIPPEILSEAVPKLETFHASDCHLTPRQVLSIFSEIPRIDHPRLKILDLTRNNLSTVPSKVLIAGITCLAKVSLNGCRLTETQLNDILFMISNQKCLSFRINKPKFY